MTEIRSSWYVLVGSLYSSCVGFQTWQVVRNFGHQQYGMLVTSADSRNPAPAEIETTWSWMGCLPYHYRLSSPRPQKSDTLTEITAIDTLNFGWVWWVSVSPPVDSSHSSWLPSSHFGFWGSFRCGAEGRPPQILACWLTPRKDTRYPKMIYGKRKKGTAESLHVSRYKDWARWNDERHMG